MIHLDGQLTTDDMVFAAVLLCHGYNPEIERDGKRALWRVSVEEIDEDAEEFVRDYRRNKLRVEPRRFARELTAVRKDVYHIMGVGDKPQGERVGRQSASG